MRNRNLSVVVASAAIALSSFLNVPAHAAALKIGTTVGQLGTGFGEPGSLSPTAINDLDANSQNEIDSIGTIPSSYGGITYGSTATKFDHITVDMRSGFVTKGFLVQVANAPNPVASNNSDWTTVATYAGQATSSGPSFNVSVPEADYYGVRVLATDKSTTANDMRINELWVFDHYGNLAPSATVTSTGSLSNPTHINDETAQDTAFGTKPLNATLTWAASHYIGAIMITGGSGASNEILNAFTITADGNPTPLITETSNTLKTRYYLLPTPVLASSLTLNVTAADTDSFARVGEIWAFEVLPEPTSLGVVAIGGFMTLLKRRRAH